MKNRLIIITAIAALALPLGATAFAADAQEPQQKQPDKTHATVVKGSITKIDGKTLTVGGKEVTYNDKTEIVKDGKPYTGELKVGDKITASIKDGIAVRIEVRAAKGDKQGANAK